MGHRGEPLTGSRTISSRRGVVALALAAATVVIGLTAAPGQGSAGTWELAWGRNVDSAGGSGEAEICTVAANCQTGSIVDDQGGEFNGPKGVAADGAGNVYVADTGNHRIQKFNSAGVFVAAWGKDVDSVGGGGQAEVCTVTANCQAGLVSSAQGGEFDSPSGVATDAAGNVYVADNVNERIQKLTSAGAFVAAWGKDVIGGGTSDFEVCAAAATCVGGQTGGLGGELNDPTGIGVDGAGNVLVADTANSRVQKFTSAGGFQRAWGKDVLNGGGTGFENCTAPASCKQGVAGVLGGEFSSVEGVAGDGAGNVYVTDVPAHRIQKFDAAGNFTRAWGKDVVAGGATGFEICTLPLTCQSSPSGALGGEMDLPRGVALDGAGTVYVSEAAGDRVQAFNSAGDFQRAWGGDVDSGGGTGFEICAIAASCKDGVDGGLGGLFDLPNGIAADPGGAVYVADLFNHRIQKFAADPVPPPPPPSGGGATPTGKRAAALKKCKKKKSAKARKKCKRKANKLPV